MSDFAEPPSGTATAVPDTDIHDLARFGYKQELHRSLGSFVAERRTLVVERVRRAVDDRHDQRAIPCDRPAAQTCLHPYIVPGVAQTGSGPWAGVTSVTPAPARLSMSDPPTR